MRWTDFTARYLRVYCAGTEGRLSAVPDEREENGRRSCSDSRGSPVRTTRTALHISLSLCLAVIGSSPVGAQKETFRYYAANIGGVSRPDLEAHIGSATAKEVASVLGRKMVSAGGLVLVLALVTNKNRPEALRVIPSSLHLKLESGETLSALPLEEVSAWARALGVAKIPQPDLLQGLEIKKGESVVALAAAFRLPRGVEAKRVEAEMTLDLGKEGTLQVKSTLF